MLKKFILIFFCTRYKQPQKQTKKPPNDIAKRKTKEN